MTAESSSGNGSAYKNATIGLAVVLGILALVGLGVVLWLLRKNKGLRQQLEDQKSQPAAMTQENQGTPLSYRDSVQPDNTDASTSYTGLSSPHQHWSTTSWKPAISPSIPEADGHQRYSELDATVTSEVTRSNHGSPRPQQTTSYDEFGFPTSPPPHDPSSIQSPHTGPQQQ